MKKSPLSAALLALIAVPAFMTLPAFAQHDHDHDAPPGRGGSPAPMHGPAPQSAPHAPPPQPHAAFGGANRPNTAQTPPPFQNRPQNRVQNNNPNPQHSFNNRANAAPANRPGNPPGNRPQGNNGPRHNFTAFHDYHRAFRAPQHFRGPAYHRPPGYYYRRWSYGEYLPAAFWVSDYWLSDFGIYDLPPPPYGAVWVRYGNDALLIDQYSGEIITVEYGVFY